MRSILPSAINPQTVADMVSDRRVQEALMASEQAIRFGGNPLEYAWARWMCFMLLGDFEKAWQETDLTEAARRAQPDLILPRHLRRVWDGTPLDNKHVLIRCYHGLGDTIQFARFIPLLKSRAAQIVVQCQEPLAPLLDCMLRTEELAILDREPEPPFQCEVELMEIPYVYRLTLNTVPKGVPYVVPKRWALEAARTKCAGSDFKVGLAWSSGGWNVLRDIGLAGLAPLAQVSGASFYSLQHGVAPHDLNGVRSPIRFRLALHPKNRVAETAALISQLDLVISVDTMVAHLAGALGKPVWVLLPFCADWRWMLDREDSPWYPTMRLFRQAQLGAWQPVIARVVDELRTAIQSRSLTEKPKSAAPFGHSIALRRGAGSR